jgi:hypothetical protein
MIVHVVLFNFSAAPEAAIAALQAGLLSLRDSVPGVLELSFGKNFTARGREFTHALLVKLADKAALDGYAAHPAHVRVVEELLAPIRADVLAVDYEC